MRLRVLTILFFTLCSYVPQAHAEISIEAAFSPSPEAVELVERTIGTAAKRIEVAAYSFTSYKIADALMEARHRGVEVRLLLDKEEGKRPSRAIEEIHSAGIPIRINYEYAIMHDKYMIIDGATIETGSFNYTASAEKHNAENVLVIRDDKTLAETYLRNWERLWNEGEDYK